MDGGADKLKLPADTLLTLVNRTSTRREDGAPTANVEDREDGERIFLSIGCRYCL